MSTNLTFTTSADDSYIEITTTGEPNSALNTGTGIGVYKDKLGETLRFKSLIAGTNITLVESDKEITINSTSIAGATGIFTTADSKQVTVVNGLITEIL